MDDTQDQQVLDANASPNHENSPSDHHDSDESNHESNNECSDTDSGNIVLSDDEEADDDDDGNCIHGKIIHSREDFSADPNVNLTIGSYKIIARIEASPLYQCVNTLSPGIVHTCSLVHAEDKFKFMAAYERVKDNPKVNQIHEIVTERGKNLVIYQDTFGDLHYYCCIKKKLPDPEVAKLFKQILNIMIEVHRVGIIPRELKLKKFFFKDEERTKLVLDTWDDSILLEDPQDDNVIEKCGCPPYVSPEVLRPIEVNYSGKKANYWSLGVILYTMLTNRYPFLNSHNITAMFNRISNGIFSIPEYVSPLAQTLIKAFIRVDPDTRLTPEEALTHEWVRLNCEPNQMAPPPGEVGDEPQESNRVPYPAFSHDQLVPCLSQANIDSPPSFILPQ